MPVSQLRSTTSATLLTGMLLLYGTVAQAAGRLTLHDDRHAASAAIAVHDVIDQDPLEPVFWAEYRLPWRRWTLRPDLGTLVMVSGGWQIWAGIRSELVPAHLPLWWAITTNVGYYRRGNGPLLGHPLEFRSGFEMWWSATFDWSVGLTFHHLSNASAGRRNPGTEILSLAVTRFWHAHRRRCPLRGRSHGTGGVTQTRQAQKRRWIRRP